MRGAGVIVAVVLVALAIAISPIGLLPVGKSTGTSPTFVWAGYATELLIDDDPSFGSPIVYNVSGFHYTIPQQLGFREWHWKVRGIGQSSPRTVGIESVVRVAVENTTLTNTGNTNVRVSGQGVTARVIVPLERASLVQGSDVEVRQQ